MVLLHKHPDVSGYFPLDHLIHFISAHHCLCDCCIKLTKCLLFWQWLVKEASPEHWVLICWTYFPLRIITYLYWQIIEGRKIMVRLLHEQIINVSLLFGFLLERTSRKHLDYLCCVRQWDMLPFWYKWTEGENPPQQGWLDDNCMLAKTCLLVG